MKKVRQIFIISPTMMATLLCAGIVGWLLFAEPLHGYSDNGNFQLLMATNDIYQLKGSQVGYTIQQYGLMRFYNQVHLDQLSSQSVVIQIAVWLNRLCFSRDLFDIRFLGGVYYGLYLGSVWLFVNGLVGHARRFRNYALAGITTLVIADSAFTLYFNSFYPHALTFILVLYVVGLFLSILRYKKENVWYTLAFFIASYALLMVNEANGLLLVPLTLMGIGILARPSGRWIHGTAVCFLGLLMLVGWMSANNQTSEVTQMNKYQAMTQGRMLATRHPERISQTTGIDPQFTLMKGQSYYPNGYTALQPESRYAKRHFSSRYNLTWLITSYIAAPKQFVKLLNMSARNMLLIRPRLSGSQSLKSGVQPFHQSNYFSIFSHILATFYPRKYAFNVLLAIALSIIYGIDYFRYLKAHNRWLANRFWLVLGLLSFIILAPPMIIVLYGTGNFATHLMPVALCLSLTGLVLLSDVVQHRLWRNDDEPQP